MIFCNQFMRSLRFFLYICLTFVRHNTNTAYKFLLTFEKTVRIRPRPKCLVIVIFGV